MLEVITAIFLLIFHSIVCLFLGGETKQIAKEVVNNIVIVTLFIEKHERC
ncbi:hypothetical protein ACYFX3_02370 [Bacillus cereus]|nr:MULTISPECIES: hypothetical protein [Bacillus cereus group]MDZ4489970.1 hypothetical protein [Bacillus cereus]MDZ4572437.1 hypothetical protein [Bacillus cereus]MEB9660406.1 hypothetical protein [Bacillus cereus]MEB9975509.1 hypothetical protein [Bacillus cereus]NSL61685.1 hypothetical protein [Bacillus cereus]